MDGQQEQTQRPMTQQEKQVLDSITLLRLQVFQKKLELFKSELEIKATQIQAQQNNDYPNLSLQQSHQPIIHIQQQQQPAVIKDTRTQELLEEIAESNLLFQRFMIESLRKHKETIQVITNTAGVPISAAPAAQPSGIDQKQMATREEETPKKTKATIDELKELKIKPAKFANRVRLQNGPFLCGVEGTVPKRRVYIKIRRYFWAVIVAMRFCRFIKNHKLYRPVQVKKKQVLRFKTRNTKNDKANEGDDDTDSDEISNRKYKSKQKKKKAVADNEGSSSSSEISSLSSIEV